jgi:hypothetical protein
MQLTSRSGELIEGSATKIRLRALHPGLLFASERRRTSGRNRMLTFRIAITAAVMGFISAVIACLIFIQIATFHAAAKAAASAAMDAASRNSRTRFDAELAELSDAVSVLSTDPSIADSNQRSETDRNHSVQNRTSGTASRRARLSRRPFRQRGE